MFENDDASPLPRGGAERFRFYPLGDRAIVVECSESGGAADWSAMAQLANHVEANRERWMIDIVPAYTNVTVVYDPVLLWREESETDASGWSMPLTGNVPYELAEQRLLDVINRERSSRTGSVRGVEIPVCYGGEDGPDLAEAAAYAGLTEVELCRRHAEADYQVAMIGFMPGFPYLIGLPESIAQPRKALPRLRVEAGAVGIAGGQTGVYPLASPGGWQLIGRTPIKLFDAERGEPSLLRSGDTVRFVPVEKPPIGDEQVVAVPNDGESGGRQLRATAAGASDDEAGFRVRKPGLHTTIQDMGRAGYRSIGLPAGGAMDSYALRVANLLVGNEEAAAALELTLVGPELAAQDDMLIAVCGAYMAPTIDGEELPMWRPVWVRSGAVLRFGSALSGCRAYIAVAGGIGVPAVLGSRSTYTRAALGGLGGRRLAAGDVVPCGAAGAAAASRWAAAWMAALAARPGSWAAAPWFAQPLAYGGGSDEHGIWLRAMPGSEFGQFSEAARTAFYRERYRVAPDSDRMGCRLDGSPLTRTTHAELLSHGVTAGAVQVPPGGGPIVLAADCQTTGGYPKIAHVAGVDLPLLAQAKPGDTIRFRHVSLEEAQRLELARERELRRLALAIRCRLP
ncbi:5-oxoprolinase subunit PxpB [Paenibacillus harenae]|uniref:KipI family sensor histidine kinase inhibitor n=1 Tax=Paenibacillus harenae TaxID=306543 RepID=A0ABT9TUI9_PAEHA|nr:5-oxoprolinase subunit PxpB [Paenibacillus harenae]MDQ0111022.1 KipI family sensor histidine kinase inhibitor [Paenibacillus harenae]